jgi:tetratricopeptide (TPR) repeat protein
VIDPFQPGALAVRVDALTELGRYHLQVRALRQADRRQPGLPVTTRYSYAFELRGQLRRAAGLLAEEARTTSPADRAFVLTLLADIDRRRGFLHRAGTDLRQALQASPSYVPAMASRARLAVARGDVQDALRRWQQVVQRIALPEYVTELGELRLALGQRREAADAFAVVTATTRLLARNGVDTDLESALFEADHGSPATALTAARAEWRRRHSIHVADVLGWSLHRDGRDHLALRYARLATRLQTPEARLWLHRGTIEADLGLTTVARRDLRRGLATDPGVSPWQAAQARRVLADLGGHS